VPAGGGGGRGTQPGRAAAHDEQPSAAARRRQHRLAAGPRVGHATQRPVEATGLSYGECCGRLHDGTATAASAEQLMRSRYSAFAVGDAAYLLAT
jgi:hypothetical protein